MSRRSAFVVLVSLITWSCDHLTEAPFDPGAADMLARAISDGQHASGNPNFFFLPPMVKNPGASGAFDAAAAPVVRICEWDVSGSACIREFAEFGMGYGISMDPSGELFQANWDTDGVLVGSVYRIRILLGTALLGYADVFFPEVKGQAKNTSQNDHVIILNDGRVLPIKFRIEENAALTAVGCEATGSEKCAVTSVSAGTTGVVELPGPDAGATAARLVTPSTGENVYITVTQLPGDVPPADGMDGDLLPPYFHVNAVDAQGNPLNYEGTAGASLSVCPQGEVRNPAGLRLFRIDDVTGIPEVHEHTGLDASLGCPNGITGTGITRFSTWGVISVITGPDLMVAAISAPEGDVVMGASPPAEITVVVRNQGADPLDPATLPMNGDGVPYIPVRFTTANRDGGSTLGAFGPMEFVLTEVLAPLAERTYTIPLSEDAAFAPLSGAAAADWVVQLELDPDNLVPEWDDANNHSRLLSFRVVAAGEPVGLPTPVLEFKSVTRGTPSPYNNTYDRYTIGVSNTGAFPDYFEFNSGLYGDYYPCYNRMKVAIYREVYNADGVLLGGLHVSGYCNFDAPGDMAQMVVSFVAGTAPPPVYLVVTDQVEGVTVRSNTIQLPLPPGS